GWRGAGRPAGAPLTAIAADGTTSALDVPGGPLPDDETITLTPLTAVGGAPVGKRIVAGVHAEPRGLQFVKPAALRITLPRAPADRLPRVPHPRPAPRTPAPPPL